jgi:hypothetical protein
MSYSEALEQQVRQMRLWESDYGTERARFFSTAMPRPEQTQMRICDMLRYAQTYFLACDLAAGLAVSSEALPNMPIGHDTLSYRTGWLWLEDPLTIEGLRLWDDRDHDDALLRAIAWSESFMEPSGRVYATFHGPIESTARPHGISLFGFFECGHGDHAPNPELIHFDTWSFGVLIEDLGPDLTEWMELNKSQLLVLFVRRFFVSFSLFVAQKIVIFETLRAERHARKRLEHQGWSDEPLVRVVRLRRTDHLSSSPESSEPVEWSCQWVVRGHWRQQFYPSKHANQPIWITPYVKGPEDKPLKPPRATIFAVVR